MISSTSSTACAISRWPSRVDSCSTNAAVDEDDGAPAVKPPARLVENNSRRDSMEPPVVALRIPRASLVGRSGPELGREKLVPATAITGTRSATPQSEGVAELGRAYGAQSTRAKGKSMPRDLPFIVPSTRASSRSAPTFL